MSNDTAYLALLLDGPLQAWGASSRFQRRTTELFPTKSGVVGMVCAAMGLSKGSAEEQRLLPALAEFDMTVLVIPRIRSNARTGRTRALDIRRMEDYHTVGGGYDPRTEPQSITRTASGKVNQKRGQAVAVVTHRQYLLDARFGVLLDGAHSLLGRAADALRNPVWGVWLGRKTCIPAAPLLVEANGENVFAERRAAFEALLLAHYRLSGQEPPDTLPDESLFDRVLEGTGFTDSIRDVPVSFGDGTSTGPDKREFAVRQISRTARSTPEDGG